MQVKKLLIIHDDPLFARSVANLAETFGYLPYIIETPGDFFRAYENFSPDVIITDLFLPDIDGIELVRWLIGQESTAPVIMIARKTPRFAEAARALAENSNLFSVSIVCEPPYIDAVTATLQSTDRLCA